MIRPAARTGMESPMTKPRLRSRFVAVALVCLAAASPVLADEKEDMLPAVERGVVQLLAEGYRIAHYALDGRRDARMILRRKYSVILCRIEEDAAAGDALEIESACFRLR